MIGGCTDGIRASAGSEYYAPSFTVAVVQCMCQ